MQFSASLLGKGSDGVVPDCSRNNARVDAGLRPWSSLGKVVMVGAGRPGPEERAFSNQS